MANKMPQWFVPINLLLAVSGSHLVFRRKEKCVKVIIMLISICVHVNLISGLQYHLTLTSIERLLYQLGSVALYIILIKANCVIKEIIIESNVYFSNDKRKKLEKIAKI